MILPSFDRTRRSRCDWKQGALLLLLLPLLFAGGVTAQPPAPAKGTRVETGEINGAPFRIELPDPLPVGGLAGLVVYCHGYQVASAPYRFDLLRGAVLRQLFLKRGFAFAESAYSRQGWAIKEGVEDTEALRRYFVRTYGEVREAYVLGHSMGGVITLATIERYPEAYQGALPMCGPLNASLNGLQERVFDMLATFDALFPGVVGPLTGLAAGAKLDGARVKAAIDGAPERAASYAARYSLAGQGEIPGVLPFFYEINRELQARAGGNPFDNRQTIYDGFGDDLSLNRTIQRVAADPRARDYLRQYHLPTGMVARPVLSLHTIHDPLIPGRYISDYAAITRLTGRQDLFTAKFTAGRGHCAFTPQQMDTAFDELRRWAREGVRPEPGEVR
jgi:pimeloyl-ACP methyl ester carboxylesterase